MYRLLYWRRAVPFVAMGSKEFFYFCVGCCAEMEQEGRTDSEPVIFQGADSGRVCDRCARAITGANTEVLHAA